MPKIKPISFLPTTISFSRIGEDSPELEEALAIEEDFTNTFSEETIIHMLKSLSTDRERTILLLLIIKEFGYKLNNEDICEQVFGIRRRWYQRIVKKIQKQLIHFNP